MCLRVCVCLLMGRLSGLSRSGWVTVMMVFTVAVLAEQSGNKASPFKLNKLCKFCDLQPSDCNTTGICDVHCEITSICAKAEEVCVSVWHRNRTVETLCHDPDLAIYGVKLNDYNNTDCLMKRYKSLDPGYYICSCSEEECNSKLIFTNDPENPKASNLIILLLCLLPLLVFISLLYIFWTFVLRRRQSNSRSKSNFPNHNFCDTRAIMSDVDHPESCSAHANNLNHNTELLPIQLDGVVGKGRFAEVYCARLKQRPTNANVNSANVPFQTVAVKIFPYEEYTSWNMEREIFLDAELRHDNILHFLTAETHVTKHQFWLITAYHPKGNLQEYLRNHQLSWEELYKLGFSLARGVSHLHSEQTPCGRPKVPIAHRDLKSSNVLVKDDMTCCLCDFGLSLKLDSSMSIDELANSGQVGTARYMAPEVLESRINLENIESFKQTDVYSMALVLWEMTSRCFAIEDVKEYELPFGKLRDHPCVESMKDSVIRDRERPEIPSSWCKHPGIKVVCETIVESWDQDPEARLTASNVVERLNVLQDLNLTSLSSTREEKIQND